MTFEFINTSHGKTAGNYLPEAWNSKVNVDRRKYRKASLKYYFLGGRRKSVKYKSEKHIPIVDQYDAKILICSILILILCILDGYFTIYLSTKGTLTINPLMKNVFLTGPSIYISVRIIITLISIICLQLLHKLEIGFMKIKIEKIFPFIIFVLCLENIWNIILIFN